MSRSKIILLSRVSIFIIFFWFGLIKVLNLSPAEELVKQLFEVTLSQANLISFEKFILLLGIGECLIGLLWLIPKWTKIAYTLLLIQMITTFGPLILLPTITWHEMLVPTLVGQYIIKNICILTLSLNILEYEIS